MKGFESENKEFAFGAAAKRGEMTRELWKKSAVPK